MAFARGNVIVEARRLMKGKKTRVHPETIVACLLAALEREAAQVPEGDEVKFLETLFRLKDPRENQRSAQCGTTW